MSKNIGGRRPGRPVGVNKAVVIKNRAIKFLEQTLKNENADDLARVEAAKELIKLNTN